MPGRNEQQPNEQERSDRELYQELSRLLDPVALCAVVGRKTHYGDLCDHTYRHCKEFAAKSSAKGARWEQIEELLSALGGRCDCEVGLNLCSRLSELEPKR